jgi:hypothetical protein
MYILKINRHKHIYINAAIKDIYNDMHVFIYTYIEDILTPKKLVFATPIRQIFAVFMI